MGSRARKSRNLARGPASGEWAPHPAPWPQELHLGTNVIEEVTEGTLNRSRSLSVLVLSNNLLQEDRLAPRAWIDLP